MLSIFGGAGLHALQTKPYPSTDIDDPNFTTILHCAVWDGDVDAVKTLLSASDEQLRLTSTATKGTGARAVDRAVRAVRKAQRNGSVEPAASPSLAPTDDGCQCRRQQRTLLLQADRWSAGALHVAAMRGSVDMMRQLLAALSCPPCRRACSCGAFVAATGATGESTCDVSCCEEQRMILNMADSYGR